jgi:hypothetical protein
MSPTLSVTKVPLEVPHDCGTTRFATEMHLLDSSFITRRSPLDPESSRTHIVLFLIFRPELTLGSGYLAQSERVFLLFIPKLLLFSSNFFDLNADLFSTSLFSFSEKGFLVHENFCPGNWHFPLFGEKAIHF